MSILQSELFTCVLPVDIKPQENISLRVMLSFSKLRNECVLSILTSGTRSAIWYFDSGNQLNKNYFYSSSTVFISSLRDTKGKNPKNTVLYFPPHVMFSKADGFQFFSP